MNWLTELVTWEGVKSLFNSAFTSSLVGALAGAYAGATAAQRIAERAKERERLLAQIRGTNAAIMVSFGVCNAGLSLKKQQIKDLCDSYNLKRAALAEFFRKRKAGEIEKATPFEFQADLRSLQMPWVPMEALRGQIYDKLSVSGRPLALVAALSGALSSLSDTIANRNRLIDVFKQLSPEARANLPALYFGLRNEEGHTSTEYADTIQALASLTDDVIFFSHLLCKDLADSGNRAVDQYAKRFKDESESIHEIDLSPAASAGLLPPDSQYGDWLRGFKEREAVAK